VNIHDIGDGDVWSIDADAEREGQRNVAAFDIAVVHQVNRARDICQSFCEVFLLPRPPHSVQIGVMQIEDRVYSGYSADVKTY
jgi:hypothetical protein